MNGNFANSAKYWIVAGFLSLVSLTLSAQEPSEEKDAAFRKEFGKIFGTDRLIELSAAEYLKMLVDGETDDRLFLEKIELLGNEDYQQRQAAEAYLLAVPVLPEKYRESIQANEDMEVKYRLNSIFTHRKNRVQKLVIAALKSIEESKQSDALDIVFEVLNTNPQRGIERAAQSAIREIATIDQETILLEELEDSSTSARLLAAELLAGFKGAKSIADLNPLLTADDEKLRLKVAQLLVDLNHKPAVNALVHLLSSANTSLSAKAERMLRAVSGQEFGNISYSDKKRNSKIADEWAKWANEKLADTELKLPIGEFLKMSSRLNGNTLIAKDSSVVVELDEDKEEIFRMNVEGVLSAEKTIDGNYLLFSYSGQWLKEFSPDKKLNWEITGMKFNNAMPLNNGNALVSIGPDSKVKEIDPKTKKTVWEYKTEWWPNDAYRLENGNTLIGGKGGVIEVDQDKNVVWELKNPDAGTIVVAKPTENEGVLIGWTNGLARVVNREKETVWEYKAAKLSDVFRDGNGNTLIATGTEIIELDLDKKIVWRMKKQSKTATVRR